MNEVTNRMPGPTLVVGSLAIGGLLAPLLIPVAGGFAVVHFIASRRKRRNS